MASSSPFDLEAALLRVGEDKERALAELEATLDLVNAPVQNRVAQIADQLQGFEAELIAIKQMASAIEHENVILKKQLEDARAEIARLKGGGE